MVRLTFRKGCCSTASQPQRARRPGRPLRSHRLAGALSDSAVVRGHKAAGKLALTSEARFLVPVCLVHLGLPGTLCPCTAWHKYPEVAPEIGGVDGLSCSAGPLGLN